MNAFAGLHDQLMRYVGMAGGPVGQLTANALNFPAMPPAVAMTYGALVAPNSFAVGGTTATSTAISNYGASSTGRREQGAADENY